MTEHILSSFPQLYCHYIHGHSDFLNFIITLETPSCDETLQGTILYNLTLTNHYQNQNFPSLRTHTCNNSWAEKLRKWKLPNCWYSWPTFTCATLKMVARVEAKAKQSQGGAVSANSRHSGALNNVAHPFCQLVLDQPQFSSLSQVSVITEVTGTLLIPFTRK